MYNILSGNGDEFRYTFATPITSSSLIEFSDVDLGEGVVVEAFDPDGNPITMDGGTETAYTGQTGKAPDPGSGGWAKWTTTGSNGDVEDTEGILESEQDDDLGDPLNVLPPPAGVTVDSLDFRETTDVSGASGGLGIQILNSGSGLSAVSGNGPSVGAASLSATLDSVGGSPLAGR